MNNLKIVKLIDGVPTVSSLAIAEHFGRNHDDVLKSIRKIIQQDEKSLVDFAERDYENRGKKYPCFELTERGFMIACPFIGGDKAVEGQVAIVNELMELRQAKPMTQMEMIAQQALAMVEVERKQLEQERVNAEQDARIKSLEDRKVILATGVPKGYLTVERIIDRHSLPISASVVRGLIELYKVPYVVFINGSDLFANEKCQAYAVDSVLGHVRALIKSAVKTSPTSTKMTSAYLPSRSFFIKVETVL